MNIIFRGKDKITKEWIYGWLVVANGAVNQDRYYMIDSVSDFSYGDNGSRIRIGCFKEVIPETVGRFTGLTDKNGTKIFEHDIILSQEFRSLPHSNETKVKRLTGVVEYKIGAGDGFCDSDKQDSSKYSCYSAAWGVKFNSEDTEKYPYSSWGCFYDCNVIGNIFDNDYLINNK